MGAVVIAFIIGIEKSKETARESLISKIEIAHVPEGCSENPIAIGFEIANNSSKTLKKIEFRLEARRSGYSSDLLESEYGLRSFVSDKILKPGEGGVLCWERGVYSFQPIAQELQAGKSIEFSTEKIGYSAEFED